MVSDPRCQDSWWGQRSPRRASLAHSLRDKQANCFQTPGWARRAGSEQTGREAASLTWMGL